jgi:hypothetical protein
MAESEHTISRGQSVESTLTSVHPINPTSSDFQPPCTCSASCIQICERDPELPRGHVEQGGIRDGIVRQAMNEPRLSTLAKCSESGKGYHVVFECSLIERRIWALPCRGCLGARIVSSVPLVTNAATYAAHQESQQQGLKLLFNISTPSGMTMVQFTEKELMCQEHRV